MAAAMVVDIVFDMVVDNGCVVVEHEHGGDLVEHEHGGDVTDQGGGKHGVALYHGSGMIIVRGSGFR